MTDMTISCLAGFGLVGEGRISCTTGGTWSSVPICSKLGNYVTMTGTDNYDVIMPYYGLLMT